MRALRVERLALPPRPGSCTWHRPHSTQVSASSTAFLREVLDGLEAHLFLLEIEVADTAELGGFQEYR